MKISHDELRSRLHTAINAGLPERRRWVHHVFDEKIVYRDERDGLLYEATYTLDAEENVYIGEVWKVEMVFVAARGLDIVGDNPPAEVQLIPFGHHYTAKGDFVLDDESAPLVMSDFGRRTNESVIDYEHQTLNGVEAPAAGWITGLVNKGKDGIWGRVNWTARARDYLKAREYRYLSPVFLKRASDDRVVSLINAALTNQPAIDGMVPVVNKAVVGRTQTMEVSMKDWMIKALGLAADATEQQVQDAVMAMKAKKLDGVVAVAHKDVLAAAGLEAGATLEAATAAIVAMKAEAAGMAGLRKELGLQDSASVSEVSGTVMAMKQGADGSGDSASRLAAIESRMATQNAEKLVQQAMKEGKVSPAQKDWAMDYAVKDAAAFEVFMAKASVVVPVKGAPAGVTAQGGGLDETQVMVNKSLGISDETFKKYNTEQAAG